MARHTASDTLSRPHALVVDDAADCREVLTELLECAGFRVCTATNGQEALAALLAMERPAVIVLDLMMPVMSGWQVLDALRSSDAFSSIPVLVVSAAHDLEEGSVHGARVLKKPIDFDEFLSAITACFSNPELAAG